MLLEGGRIRLEKRYMIALFVCISSYPWETRCWAGYAFGFTQYGLASRQSFCGHLCEQESEGLYQTPNTSFPKISCPWEVSRSLCLRQMPWQHQVP